MLILSSFGFKDGEHDIAISSLPETFHLVTDEVFNSVKDFSNCVNTDGRTYATIKPH